MIDGLTQDQEQGYRRGKKVQTYFGTPANTIKVNGYLPLKNEVADMNINIGDVETKLPRKTANTTGNTAARIVSKHDVANAYEVICKKSLAYARKIKNADLIGELKHFHSEIFHLPHGDIFGFCQHINDVITPFIADPVFVPYGVTALNLSDALALATTFKGKIGDTEAADADKAAAASIIGTDLSKVHDNIEQEDLLMVHFKTSDPDFYSGWIAVNVVDDIGVRHSGLEGNVKKKSDGSAIIGATVKNLQTGRVTTTDVTGFYSITKMQWGTFQFEVSAAGYKTIVLTIKINKGRISDVDFEMESL